MTDIAERLRTRPHVLDALQLDMSRICTEAAEEIERLHEQIRQLRLGGATTRPAAEIEEEIKRISALQAACYDDILHGAALALNWLRGLGAAPSEVETVLRGAEVSRARPPEKIGTTG